MAEQPVTATITQEAVVLACTGLANGDTMATIECPQLSDKTVHIYGTFGTGGSVTIYGSNDIADKALAPDNAAAGWIVLSDPNGNSITKTSKAIEVILENPRYITAKVTAGDGTTSLKIFITAKRS